MKTRLLMLFLGILNLSMSNPSDRYINYDFENIAKVSNYPNAPVSRWNELGNLVASYNQWMCFPAEGISINCSEHEMGEVVKTPMIAVYDEDHLLEIETSVVENVECELVVELWNNLIEGQNEFCVLAAFLQDLIPSSYQGKKKRSLWILDAFYTVNGEWLAPSLKSKMSN
ncbi:MAG: hypothetical protein KDD58_14980 [Bdellovibrionales bacterium]|nr:hypothetical protein [Bdellovibrionales bacterium]